MYIDKFKKIVIKIGSSILVDRKGKPKKSWLKEFAKDIKSLLNKKKQIVIVSSGAIALGCEYLQINKKINAFSKKIKKKIYSISALKHKGLTTIKRMLVNYVY